MNMMKETKRNSLQVVPTLYSTAVTLILIQLLLHIKSTESASIMALPGCQESCGDIAIPYPFGIGLNCSLNAVFNVTCHTTYKKGIPTPYLEAPAIHNNGTLTPYPVFSPILNISLSLGQVRVGSLVASRCYNIMTKKDDYNTVGLKFGESLWLNTEKNKFTVIGCNTLAYLGPDLSSNSLVGCLSSCDSLEILKKYGSCSGIGCCQTAIPKETSDLGVWFDDRTNKSEVHNFSRCSYATVLEEAAFIFETTYITNDELSALVLTKTASVGHLPLFLSRKLPVLFNWAIEGTTCEIAQTNKSSYACRSDHSICLKNDHGYLCNCSDGYEGNPYLDGGCQDTNECVNPNACSKPGICHNYEGGYRCSCPFGWRSNHNNPGPAECDLNVALVTGMAAVLGIGTAFSIILLYFAIAKRIKLFEKRKQEKLKHKFFVQNRGLVIQQLLASQQDTTQQMRNFRLLELEKATNRFDNALILGRGGHGEVYKGILSDQRVVAIKRSKIVDKTEIDQFINEVVILSQVNHRNIVKLYGCCLETEVPLLVYEFISNRTLFNHLHVEEHCSLTWKHRLRIALEAAGAISYLHSSASISVFHRDIKSSNILLDDYFTAKVSDFGASRSVQIDETGVTTAIQGTFGYLDPEYYSTGRLTQKSDVYSFGVILAELLTRQKPLISSRVFEGGSLISYFRSAMQENRLFEILDPQVVNEGHRTELEAVAKLAEMCLRMKGEKRPTMKEVEIRLEVYNAGIDSETLVSEQSPRDEEIVCASNYFNIDKEAEESIAMGR